jgi:hypothetical protein
MIKELLTTAGNGWYRRAEWTLCVLNTTTRSIDSRAIASTTTQEEENISDFVNQIHVDLTIL